MSLSGTIFPTWENCHFPTLRIVGDGDDISSTLDAAFEQFGRLAYGIIDLRMLETTGKTLLQRIQAIASRTILSVVAVSVVVIDQCLLHSLAPFPTIRSAELSLMGDHTISQLQNGLRDIPSRKPQAAMIINYLSGPGVTMEVLEERIRTMPLLVCQILHLASASGTPPETLMQALSRLGLGALHRLAQDNFVQGHAALHVAQAAVLADAQRCAVLADLLARELGFDAADRSRVWLAALLKNLGILGMSFFFPERYFMALGYMSRKVKRLQAEFLSFGVNHQIIGRIIAMRWNFSAFLVSVVSRSSSDGFFLKNPVLMPVACADAYVAAQRDGAEVAWEPLLENLFKTFNRPVPWARPAVEFEQSLASVPTQ